ncbi:hypothetical protein D3C76_1499380 [compost metagenome]
MLMPTVAPPADFFCGIPSKVTRLSRWVLSGSLNAPIKRINCVSPASTRMIGGVTITDNSVSSGMCSTFE